MRKLLGLTLALVALSACRLSPEAEFLQGTWVGIDAHLADYPLEGYLETYWIFSGNAYSQSVCCFTEVEERGHFRIAEQDGNRLTLEMFDIEGHIGGITIPRDAQYEMIVEIDPAADTIEIGNAVLSRQAEIEE